jgi:hypothetical protein
LRDAVFAIFLLLAELTKAVPTREDDEWWKRGKGGREGALEDVAVAHDPHGYARRPWSVGASDGLVVGVLDLESDGSSAKLGATDIFGESFGDASNLRREQALSGWGV